MSKPLPGLPDKDLENPESHPLVFESQLFRAALGEKVSESLGKIYRDLCGLIEKIPQGTGLRKELEKQKILSLIQDASREFFEKMRTRVANQILQELNGPASE